MGDEMNDLLRQISDATASAVDAAARLVVRVEARRRLPSSGIVWSEDGLVVAAHHAVHRDEDISVGLPDGQSAKAELVGRDPRTDIALLRATGTRLSSPHWSTTDQVRVGHLVLALGRPGTNVMATLGIVSALNSEWRTPAGGHIESYLQTDIVMYPGFSGGPLVDTQGHVLGMNTSGLVRGASMAVPGPTLRSVVETLLKHGRVRRGYLGIAIQPIRLPDSVASELDGQETGLLLVSVEPGGPAARAGLFLGDTIVSLHGQATGQLEQLTHLLDGDSVAKEVTLSILRAGELRDTVVVVGERPQ
jgi:S1-C subfamily serine protease